MHTPKPGTNVLVRPCAWGTAPLKIIGRSVIHLAVTIPIPVFTSLNAASPKISPANCFNAADLAEADLCDITVGTCFRYKSKMESML
ncbi:hypothetical protein D3C80_1678950 [compost metagenome]